MKLGVSYNIFDGEELLEGSIKCIRDQVDYISVVYQTTSNFGNPCDTNLVPLLNELKEKGLIDELFEYKPKLTETYNTLGIKIIEGKGHFNELTKRNVGLSLSVGSKCTHHMSMDSDEYYLPEQFKFLKEEIINGDYDSSYSQMRTYYKSWEYQLDPPEEYYVSLIYKINQYSLFEMGKYSPVLVDPTRRMDSGKYRIFKREEIEMHHGSYIRNNIRTKLDNSSASTNFKNDIEKIVSHYNNWEYPNKVLWGGLPSTLHNVKKVKNLF